MDIIKRIIGEAEDSTPPKDKAPPEPKESAPVNRDVKSAISGKNNETDAETNQIASLWKTGNKEDVTARFMDMDNVTAVKLVFAIGREDALELAQMADQVMEETEATETGAGEEEPDSTEPIRTSGPPGEPPEEPAENDYPVSQLIGK